MSTARRVQKSGPSASQKKAAGKVSGAPKAALAAPFPPLSTSMEFFIDGDSDQRFRELIYKVLSISTLMLRARDRFAAEMGVTGPQYSMMVAIGEAGTATVGQIAERLHVSSPFVTAEIGKLVKRGILSRQPNESDRRSSLLTLTARGKDLIRDVGPFRCATNDMIFGSLSSPQARVFSEIVDKLLSDGERAIHHIHPPGWDRKPNDKSVNDT